MAPNFDIDLFDEEIKNAPRVGYGPRSTFGKLTILDIQIAAFERSGGTVTAKFRPFVGKDKADKEKGEYYQTTFGIDVQEMSAQAKENEWTWERRVDVKQNSADGKVQTDWDAIVLPSLVSAIGKDWMKKLSGKGVYVEVLEPETVETYAKSNEAKGYKKGDKKGWTDKNDGSWHVNTTFQVVRAFANKKECEAARAERFASREEEGGNGKAASMKIPAGVIKDVGGILNVYDGDTSNEEFLELIREEPYSQYPEEELIAAAEKFLSK